MPRGINITAKAADIRRIILGNFQVAPRLDPDDLVQEVLFTIHRRNSLPSAFDAARSAFSTYVCLVTRNVIGHMLDAPRWRLEASAEEAPEVTDDRDPFAALDSADAAGMNVDASRELGELVPRRPRQLWELALEQRAAALLDPVMASQASGQRPGTAESESPQPPALPSVRTSRGRQGGAPRPRREHARGGEGVRHPEEHARATS